MSASRIFGSVVESTLVDDQQEIVFRVPAFSETLARRRATRNARIKGVENPEVEEVEEVGSGTLPGQTIFLITVRGER